MPEKGKQHPSKKKSRNGSFLHEAVFFAMMKKIEKGT